MSAYPSQEPGGLKYCPRCQTTLPLRAFHRNKKRPDGRAGYCKSCRKESEYPKSPERVRAQNLRDKYKLTLAQYDLLLADQSYVCAICGASPEKLPLSIDHDHSCCPEDGKSCGSCIRQLLCAKCNRGLGHFDDSPELLRKAAEYIERHAKSGNDIAV